MAVEDDQGGCGRHAGYMAVKSVRVINRYACILRSDGERDPPPCVTV